MAPAADAPSADFDHDAERDGHPEGEQRANPHGRSSKACPPRRPRRYAWPAQITAAIAVAPTNRCREYPVMPQVSVTAVRPPGMNRHPTMSGAPQRGSVRSAQPRRCRPRSPRRIGARPRDQRADRSDSRGRHPQTPHGGERHEQTDPPVPLSGGGHTQGDEGRFVGARGIMASRAGPQKAIT
jgi:hypothetical protein